MTRQEETAQPLVFLHGWGTDSTVWLKQASHFHDTRQIYCPTILHWSKDTVVELFHQRVRNEAILIGWSLGAMLALEAFAEIRHRLAGLVLIGCAARFCRGTEHPLGVEVARVRAMRRRLQRKMTSALNDFFGLFFTPAEEDARMDFEKLSISNHCADSCREGLDYLMRKDLRSLLPLIDKPTLIVHGQHDQVSPLGQAEYVHRSIQRSTLLVFEQCGHMPFYSRAVLFNKKLEEFCRAC
jgi:pimeloyl-ACP methyl ester carboxylesterase